MIKEIISSRNEDYSFFVHCNCGNEIIQFYYYRPTNIDEEIIGIRYYGYVKNVKDSRCTSFTFTRETFNNFIESTYNAIYNENTLYGVIQDNNAYLIFNKDKHGFYTLLKARSKILLLKKQYVWDIMLRKPEVQLLYDRLLKMKEVIWKC